MIDLPNKYPDLSQRQLEVMQLMTQGRRLKEMAFELGIMRAVTSILAALEKNRADTTLAVWRHAQRQNNC